MKLYTNSLYKIGIHDIIKTITDMDYAVDKYTRLIQNPAMEWAAAGVGLHVNADNTEYMCFYQRCDIFTLMAVLGN